MVRHLRFVSSGAVPAFPGLLGYGLLGHVQAFAASSIMCPGSNQYHPAGYYQTVSIMVRQINKVDLHLCTCLLIALRQHPSVARMLKEHPVEERVHLGSVQCLERMHWLAHGDV